MADLDHDRVDRRRGALSTYENGYVREAGDWRIASLHGVVNPYVEYADGPLAGGVPLVHTVDGLEPDLPPSIAYEAFPEPVITPFHYP